jgi:hypothetical protein
MSTATLTKPPSLADAEKTTSNNGNTGPREHSGIFVSTVQRSGLLTRHQGQGTTPVSRIGGRRLTRRNKPKVRLGTNKPGRLFAVVDAVVRPSLCLGRLRVRSFIDYGATSMTTSSNGPTTATTPTFSPAFIVLERASSLAFTEARGIGGQIKALIRGDDEPDGRDAGGEYGD